MENDLNPDITNEIEPTSVATKPTYWKYIYIVAVIIVILVLIYLIFRKDKTEPLEEKPKIATDQKEKVKTIINDLEKSFPEEPTTEQEQEPEEKKLEETEKVEN